MTYPRFVFSLLISFLLAAVFLTGCEQKKSLAKTTNPETNTAQPQPIPVDEPTSSQPPPQHVASTPAHAVVSRQAPLDISQGLLPADVEKVFAKNQLLKGPLTVIPFAGQLPSPEYNALRIAHDDDTNTHYGIGLQVWKFDDVDTAKYRLNELKQQYLGVQSLPASLKKVSDDAFVSERGGMRSYLFVTEPSNIVGLSCEKPTCPDWSSLSELAKIVQSRL